MKEKIKSKFSIAGILLLILGIISIIGKYNIANNDGNLSQSIYHLEKYIADFDTKFEILANNNTIDSFDFVKNNKFIDDNNKEYILLLYKNDEPIFWTSNKVSFPVNTNLKNEKYSIQKLKNVWCYVINHEYDKNYSLVGVLPIKYTQDIKNNYLTDEFIVKNVDESYDISKNVSYENSRVNNKNHQAIFGLLKKQIIKKYNCTLFYTLINLLFLFVLFYLIYNICDKLANYTKEWVAFLVLCILVLAVRLLFFSNFWMYHLQNSSLFDPTLLGSPIFNTSLGIFIVNTIIFGLVSLYFYTHIRFKKVAFGNNLAHILYVFIFILLYLSHFILIYTYKDIILNSTIPLDLTNILKLNQYSIIVYIMFSIISISYVMISYNFYKSLKKLKAITNRSFIIYNSIAIIVYLIVIFIFHLDLICYAGIVVMLVCNVLIHLYFSNNKPFDSIYSMLIILSFTSLITAVYSNYFHFEKNRKLTEDVIHKLSDDRDYITEFSFTDIHCRVTEDPFVKRIFTSKLEGDNTSTIINRISQLYFRGYLVKYDLDLHLFDINGKSLIESDSTNANYYESEIKKYGFETSDFYLHFIEKSTENYYYSALIPVYNDTTQVGNILFNLKPKTSATDNLYPELLLSKNIQKSDGLNDVNYLVINNKRILKSKGSIPYEFTNKLNLNIPLDTFIWLSDNAMDYVVYKTNERKSIILSQDKISFFKYITSYSYVLILFITVFLCVFLLFAIHNLLENFEKKPWLNNSLAFYDKINITLFSLLLFSFFAIAIITTLFISNQYETSNKQNLTEISTSISNRLQDFIVKNNINNPNSITLKEDFSYIIPQISNDEKVDINIYDDKGTLAISSQFSIFEKGLQATKINPRAYSILKNKVTNQELQSESIGKLDYLSLYMPLYDEKNQLIAYMNIPYFSQTKMLKDEISRFLVALINVYVPLLLITGLLALFISNSLTKPLSQIGNQLRKIRLGKVNESIKWNQKDEIGLLVEEYNKMILKLDESANVLKKSEREGAWREMAKQIAHEIKNPLTPMRLSIQYLQRAINENNPNAPQLTLNMTHTFLEQIDNLSEIATAFSSFAQMPVASNEKLDLDHYLNSIINLFSDEHNVTINYQCYSKPAWIFADKNQMVSLFNNLIKNAIQALTEDRPGVIDIYLIEEYGTIKTIIIDNGKGIPDEIQDRIFTPNFTTKNSGSGLGLAISKQIIENAGGSIWFESQENIGTTFYVVLPKYEDINNATI
jgi:signal transduction histidine kinase